MFLLNLTPKWPIMVSYCLMDHEISLFYWFLAPFILEAVEDSEVTFNQIKAFKNSTTTRDSQNTFKPYLTYIFLSARANYRMRTIITYSWLQTALEY